MDNAHEELLTRELAKVGKLGGRIGGGMAGGIGGWIGARIAGRLLPTEQFQQHLTVAQRAEVVLDRATTFLASQGRVVGDDEAGASPFPKVSGLLGSGFLKTNPTVVHVEVLEAQAEGCIVRITGAAKDGLIRQRSAEKAVQRIVEFLAPSAPPVQADGSAGTVVGRWVGKSG